MVLKWKDLFKKQTNSITNQSRLDIRKKILKKHNLDIDKLLDEPLVLNKFKKFEEEF